MDPRPTCRRRRRTQYHVSKIDKSDTRSNNNGCCLANLLSVAFESSLMLYSLSRIPIPVQQQKRQGRQPRSALLGSGSSHLPTNIRGVVLRRFAITSSRTYNTVVQEDTQRHNACVPAVSRVCIRSRQAGNRLYSTEARENMYRGARSELKIKPRRGCDFGAYTSRSGRPNVVLGYTATRML